MNKTQKLILAIFVPIIFFFIVLMIANSVGVSWSGPEWVDLYGNGHKRLMPGYQVYNPFYWEKTWVVWLIYSASCCLFEFLIFRDKK